MSKAKQFDSCVISARSKAVLKSMACALVFESCVISARSKAQVMSFIRKNRLRAV